MTPADKLQLLEWYRHNQRPLPWRLNRDPYRVWISETMLQQTTTTAVIPYYEKFLKLFPRLEDLAAAPESAIIATWAGLGYYSRARNLHKAAKALVANGGFPRTHFELMEYPGLGPYTARAVASIAFDDPVGVVDGNVIRVLSRVHGQAWRWWENKVRAEIQQKADQWVAGVPAHEMNQALMELGATICTPTSPACLLCPLRTSCEAFKKQMVHELPLPKPRRARETWLWQAHVVRKKGRVLLAKNISAPFLKGQWLLPGTARLTSSKPKRFHYRHSITHHDIFVTISDQLPKLKKHETKWVAFEKLSEFVPASLVHKALRMVELDVHSQLQERRPKRSTARKSRLSQRSRR